MASKKIHVRIRIHCDLDGFGSRLIAVFMVLLIAAGVCLSVGNRALAEDLAVYAYYFLAAGVIVKLIDFMKSKGQ